MVLAVRRSRTFAMTAALLEAADAELAAAVVDAAADDSAAELDSAAEVADAAADVAESVTVDTPYCTGQRCL